MPRKSPEFLNIRFKWLRVTGKAYQNGKRPDSQGSNYCTASQDKSSCWLRHSKSVMNIERDRQKIGASMYSGLEVWGWAEVPPDPSGPPVTKKSPNLGRLGD
jgi:hypothetical protein